MMPAASYPEIKIYGPDESMEELTDTAELQEIVEGENVEKMDRLLSLAITGGDYEWL